MELLLPLPLPISAPAAAAVAAASPFVGSLDFICFDMDLAAILSEEELLALLVSSGEKLEKVGHLKRVQLVSLCQAQARALDHFRSAPQILPQPDAV